MIYPLIKELGLQTFLKLLPDHYLVDADELEAILQKATVVYGQKNIWLTKEYVTNPKTHTHTALLINVKPIKQKTTLEKISDLLDNGLSPAQYKLSEIKKLIEEQK